MRFGVVCELTPNGFYRAFEPMKAMQRRGHEVVWPDGSGRLDPQRLATCDVVHTHRLADANSREVVMALARGGKAITFDNDDDLAAIQKESPHYKTLGALRGQRAHAMTLKLAKLARVFTTTCEALAERYRSGGVKRVEVIPNSLATDVSRPRVRHEGVVIGWIAGPDHWADAARIEIADALRRVVERHKSVRVECIGVDLALPERYRHDELVPFEELPRRIGGFDIGIAPMVDIPFNQSRSDIKVKEYAASEVPWLASPVAPYLALGEEQGGRLVPDDGWFDALDRLVTHGRERRRLGRNAKKWAKSQTIEALADRWEQVFLEAAGRDQHGPEGF